MRASSFALIGFLLALGDASAQQPSPSPSPTTYVRFWNMLPKGAPSLDLIRTGGAEAPLIAGAAPMKYSSYRELPPARYQVTVVRAGEDTTPLGTADVTLKANQFITLVVHGDPRRPKVEVLDDTVTERDTGGTVTVWNFFPDIAPQLSLGTHPAVAIAYGSYQRISGLPPSGNSAKIQGKLPNGTPLEADIPIDLSSTTRRATLLMIPDSYGRFRPRVVADGVNL